LDPISKSEKRLAQKALKEAKRLGKQARQIENPVTPSPVRQREQVEARKRVLAGADPKSILQDLMTWTIDNADREGAWSWGIGRDWDDQTWATNLHPKLKSFATMTWGQIHAARAKAAHRKTRRCHHEMDRATICVEAQDRLAALALNHDVLFRFRLDAKKRLWGYRMLARFHALWYDPTHMVYPVDP
jgi:hypothetical protein